METQYRRDLNHTYLTLKINEVYSEDYQMRMLKRNKIDGLLLVAGHGVNEDSRYAYDISGKSSVKAIYEKADIPREDLENFLKDLLKLIKTLQSYMLDINKIILDPEYIFYEKGKFYFCYLPKKEEEMEHSFHKLTEYFVSKIDHADQEGIRIAYILHKVTMEENYNLETIIEQISKKQEEEEEQEEQEEEQQYDQEDDWIEYKQEEDEKQILRETPISWNHFIEKRKKKKEKWGMWE